MILYTIFRESSDPQERKKGLARQWRQINRFAETWPGGPHSIYEPHAQVIKSASQGSRREWEQAVERGMLGIPLTDDDLVFGTPEGKPLRPDTVTQAWTTLAARCGLKVIRLHDARHTHASLMLKQGVHPKVESSRKGLGIPAYR